MKKQWGPFSAPPGFARGSSWLRSGLASAVPKVSLLSSVSIAITKLILKERMREKREEIKGGGREGTRRFQRL